MLLVMIPCLLTLASRGWGADKSDKGRPAPKFSARNLQGERVTLEDLLERGPVVLTFWTTWCKPCIQELLYLQKHHAEDKEKRLTIVGINEDGPGNWMKVKPFVRKIGLTVPVLLDEDGKIARAYKVWAYPVTVVIDSEGRIQSSWMGYKKGDEAKLDAEIREVLAESTAEEDEEPSSSEETETVDKLE